MFVNLGKSTTSHKLKFSFLFAKSITLYPPAAIPLFLRLKIFQKKMEF